MSLTLSAETSATQTTEKAIKNQSDYSGSTLLALHRALIRLRTLAYEGTEPRTLGRMLDDIEYLGVLAMQSRTNNSQEHVEDFRLHLQDLETKYQGFGHLTAAFDDWQKQ